MYIIDTDTTSSGMLIDVVNRIEGLIWRGKCPYFNSLRQRLYLSYLLDDWETESRNVSHELILILSPLSPIFVHSKSLFGVWAVEACLIHRNTEFEHIDIHATNSSIAEYTWASETVLYRMRTSRQWRLDQVMALCQQTAWRGLHFLPAWDEYSHFKISAMSR